MTPEPTADAPPGARVAQQRASLDQAGAVVVPGLLDQTWCERLRDAIERTRRHPSVHHGVLSPPAAPRVESDLFRWRDDPDLRALTHDSPVVDLAAALLGQRDVVLVEDQWFRSEPGATTPSPWHQDQPYYRLDRPFLTIWVTLDDIGAAGSLRVVPGSHRGPRIAPVPFVHTGHASGDEPAVTVPVPRDAAVQSWTLRAGDAVALDSRVLHATGSAALPHAFRRISTRWATSDTRYVDAGGDTAAFWDLIEHGRSPGDLLACDAFPLIRRRTT